MRLLMIGVITLAYASIGSQNSRVVPAVQSECTITDDLTDKSRCDNLLPNDFEKYPNNSPVIESLLSTVQRIELQTLPDGEVTEERQANWTCAGIGGANNPIVRYRAPKALLSLPSAGSKQRKVVTAVFEVVSDKGCHEWKYRLRKKASGWNREAQFVSTDVVEGVVHDPKRDVKIGKWTSWAIVKKDQNGVAVFKLEKLSNGDYLLCGTTHDSTDSMTVAFLGCDAQRALYSAAKSNAFGANVTLDSAIALLKARDTTATRIVSQRFARSPINATRYKSFARKVEESRFFSLTLAAWGRCGNLGCCALE